MRVALTFGYFGMLRQSNLAPSAGSRFDATRHTCRGDVTRAAPGLVILLKWTKTLQSSDKSHLLPLPTIPHHTADPVAAYKALVKASPTLSANQPLLTISSPKGLRVITARLLASALKEMLRALGLDSGNYSLHSLRRGGATSSYLGGVDPLLVQRHGTWSSNSFWDYITAPVVASSPVAAALAATVAAV